MYSVMKWQVKFREYISGLNLPRDDYRGIMEYIDEVPVIRPRGRWVERKVMPIRDTGIDEVQTMRCRECSRWLTTPYMYYLTKYNFCPNCGADMREEEQDATD